jgi:hypothetical protein
VHSCAAIVCTRPSDVSATEYAVITEDQLDLSAGPFSVTLACASGYESISTPTAVACSVSGDYSVTDPCTRMVCMTVLRLFSVRFSTVQCSGWFFSTVLLAVLVGGVAVIVVIQVVLSRLHPAAAAPAGSFRSVQSTCPLGFHMANVTIPQLSSAPGHRVSPHRITAPSAKLISQLSRSRSLWRVKTVTCTVLRQPRRHAVHRGTTL